MGVPLFYRTTFTELPVNQCVSYLGSTGLCLPIGSYLIAMALSKAGALNGWRCVLFRPRKLPNPSNSIPILPTLGCLPYGDTVLQLNYSTLFMYLKIVLRSVGKAHNVHHCFVGPLSQGDSKLTGARRLLTCYHPKKRGPWWLLKHPSRLLYLVKWVSHCPEKGCS